MPVVRSTGGLADTITDVRSEPVMNGKVNGFSFKEYNADLLLSTIIRALDFFKNKAQWARLMKNGMSQDWSWERSAREYLTLYKRVSPEE